MLARLVTAAVVIILVAVVSIGMIVFMLLKTMLASVGASVVAGLASLTVLVYLTLSLWLMTLTMAIFSWNWALVRLLLSFDVEGLFLP